MQVIPHAMLIVLLTLGALGATATGAEETPTRATISLDAGWRFANGDHPGAQEPGHDDASWRELDVPHDWGIEGPFDRQNPSSGEGGFLPTGVGWYRKPFRLQEISPGQRVFVEFDGVMANSDVWINGTHLGRRPNGYVSFRYDLTQHLRHQSDNVLAVRADTSAQVASRWYTGSGIYRHVRLVVVDALHIDYHGVFVATPQVDQDSATVEAMVTVRNSTSDSQKFTLRSTLCGPDGNPIATLSSPAHATPEDAEVVAVTFDLPQPKLWDVDSPWLYTISNQLFVEDDLRDELDTRFGIRKAEFRSDTGFWLNGRNLKIKGVCLHHAAGAMGSAVPLGIWEHRLNRLRELGVNAIRTAHNPVSPEFLDLCDRMGFLVMDEFFDCWKVAKRRQDYHQHFDAWAHRDMRDTILRDRNHPSVILYSVGNEIHDTRHEEQAKNILQGLVEVCHRTDPTRPVTQALFRPNVSHDYDNGLADMLDVIGTNYRDLELLQAHRDNPKRKIIGTEQGHNRGTWLACRDNRQHAGQFLWVGIDYLGESRRWPVTTFNSGLLDRTGHPHPRGYERQSWWSDRPMVRLFRREGITEETPTDPGYEAVEWRRRQVLFSDWTPRNPDPHRETVEVYSNCEEVELFLNDMSLGAKPLPSDAGPRVWKTTFEPGALLAVARNNGTEAARHEVRTASAARRIALSVSHDSLTPNGDDVAIVAAQVVDAAGTPLPRDVREITFHIEGPGKVIAVDSGSIVSQEDFQRTKRTTHQGRCVAYIRAAQGEGVLNVSASTPGLEEGRLRMKLSP